MVAIFTGSAPDTVPSQPWAEIDLDAVLPPLDITFLDVGAVRAYAVALGGVVGGQSGAWTLTVAAGGPTKCGYQGTFATLWLLFVCLTELHLSAGLEDVHYEGGRMSRVWARLGIMASDHFAWRYRSYMEEIVEEQEGPGGQLHGYHVGDDVLTVVGSRFLADVDLAGGVAANFHVWRVKTLHQPDQSL